MERRVILHSDANAFYASVECALNPALRGKAVAVCGSTENRHGIVLAKSELAKRAGVKTGMANWQAKALCRDLIFFSPRHDIYAQFSERLREIYARYTDYIEPFGLDECWLDVTARKTDPRALADGFGDVLDILPGQVSARPAGHEQVIFQQLLSVRQTL